MRFEAIVGRGALASEPDKAGACCLLARLLAAGGRLSLAEVLPAAGTRLGALLDLSGEPPELVERLRAAEERVYRDPEDPLTAWEAGDYARRLGGRAGGGRHDAGGPRRARGSSARSDVERWLGEPSGSGERGNYRSRLELSREEGERLAALARAQLAGKEVAWTTVTLFLTAARIRS